MAKKGLSYEEKVQKLLDALTKINSFYILKEVEKIGVAEGLNGMQVKDLLQGLVAENLVECDKIGSQNVYWRLSVSDSARVKLETSRKVKEITDLSAEHETMLAAICTLEKRCSELESEVESLAVDSGENETDAQSESVGGDEEQSSSEIIRSELLRSELGRRRCFVVAQHRKMAWKEAEESLLDWCRSRGLTTLINVE